MTEVLFSYAVVLCETAHEKTLAVYHSFNRAVERARKEYAQLPEAALVQIVEWDGETGREVGRDTVKRPCNPETCPCERCQRYRLVMSLLGTGTAS